MKINSVWREKMRFEATADQQLIAMDAKAPIGAGTAPTPKELLLAAVCGCTGMDVIALLRKFRQPVQSLEIAASATPTENVQPAVFREIRLEYRLTGPVDAAQALEAVRLSQTRYCGVSAMIAKAVPITYVVLLNEREIGSGAADFPG